MWGARSPPHSGSHPVVGPHGRRALAGVQRGVGSAEPSVPTEMPRSPWLLTAVPAGPVNIQHGTASVPECHGSLHPGEMLRGRLSRPCAPSPGC